MPKKRSDFYSEFYKEREMPKFEHEDMVIPMPWKVITQILSLLLEFSYNYRLILSLMSIFEREVTACNLGPNLNAANEQFFLSQSIATTV